MMQRTREILACTAVLTVAGAASPAPASTSPDEQAIALRAKQTLEIATEYFRSLSASGGYARSYEEATERLADDSPNGAAEIEIEPPGTPAMGECFLRAHAVTGTPMYLDAAVAAGRALAWGQNANGGWWSVLEGVDVPPEIGDQRPKRPDEESTLDEGTTQSALRFLIGLDRVVDAPWLDEAIGAGLSFMLESQGEAGGWPQIYPPVGDFRDYYTFNDNVINTAIELLLFAHGQYGDGRFLESARRGADFIIASQLPAPQAGWAQQYDDDLRPAPARQFEPASVSSHPTGKNIATLLQVYEYTADEKYLAPIPAAIDWLERSAVAREKWARFYELETNRPIYPDRSGHVHYEFEALPEEDREQYSYRGTYGIPGTIDAYRALVAGEKVKNLGEWRKEAKLSRIEEAAEDAARDVPDVIAAMDGWGQWAEDGKVRTETFVHNCETILDYLEY